MQYPMTIGTSLYTEGAFKVDRSLGGTAYTAQGGVKEATGDIYYDAFTLNASRSSSIYGASTVVRPKSLGVAWYIKF